MYTTYIGENFGELILKVHFLLLLLILLLLLVVVVVVVVVVFLLSLLLSSFSQYTTPLIELVLIYLEDSVLATLDGLAHVIFSLGL